MFTIVKKLIYMDNKKSNKMKKLKWIKLGRCRETHVK